VSEHAPEEAAVSNAQLAAIMASKSLATSGHLARALRRASRRAFEWPEEAAGLLAAQIRAWVAGLWEASTDV
jgi:hypothetical protein